ncbi:MAG TPA: amino acid adenylation domain-containing protein, partial [Thermoanaerobaculia bacterium]|nr:amino acid adenylation domain-containing protein [Thermoanaerobaculia bacterium]
MSETDEGMGPLRSLVALLHRRAVESPDRGYTYLAQGEEAAARLSYAGLDRRARAIAAALTRAVPPGERTLLLYPPGLDFVAAFFGCLYAGVIAVPAYPPHSRRPDPRLSGIAADCRPRAVLTTAALLARSEAIAAQVPELAPAVWLDTETLDTEPLGEEDRDADWIARPDDIAFLQYTSGSTGTPKGVMVSHANLLHNLESIRRAFGQTAESVVVGWLPLFHDMGLIGNVLQPCYVGSDCVLMPPAAFLQKPARWLQAIQRFRGTTSGGPNFAYDLCVRSIGPEAREGLDLSSWSVAFNGAEPVRRVTLDRFAEAFAPSGFRREAFVPSYGLAEASLLVTAGGAAGGVSEGPGVSCGTLPDDEEVRIVDPESGRACAGDETGEIWVSGPSVAAGYWNRPAETRETFGAVAEDGGGPFLRTGDLGFVRDGELFITGRLKDLIILRGRNLYPQDLELTAEQSHPALRPGSGAAFSVEADGEERLVLVHEVERRFPAGDLAGVGEAVRRAVADEHGVPVADVVLLCAGTIPKTSSGKIRRRECRNLYLGNSLEALYRTSMAPAGPGRQLTRVDLLALDPPERSAALTAWLRKEIARRAGVAAERIEPETVLAAAGLDSLGLFDLQARLEVDLGLAPAPASLAELSLAELRDRLLDGLAAEPEDGRAGLPPLVRGEILGEHPLSPGQEALWYLEQSIPTEGVFHIAAAARLGAEMDAAALLRAAEALTARHPALRTTFSDLGQRVHASLPPDLDEVDATAWSAAELDAALRREARRRFDLAQGSPLRLRLFTRLGGERVLLLVLHHLAGDFWSLAVLLRDWALLYDPHPLTPSPTRTHALPGEGEPAKLSDLPAAYTDFVRWQRALLAGPAGERLESFWLDRLHGAPLILDLPTDRPRPLAAAHAGALLGLRLDPEETGRLRELARAHGATLFATLLAAFQTLLGRLTGQDDLLVGAPTTGRRDRDFDGVVGYFVNPLVLRAELAGDPPFSGLLATSRQTLAEALEHRDLPFPQLARRLRPARDPARPPVFQVQLVFQQAAPSQTPGLAAFAVGEAGACIDLEGLALESLRLDPGTAQLDLTLFAAEAGGALVLSCEHDTALFDGVTIGRWLGHLRTLLAAVAESPETRLGELPLLTGAERHQLLREWSDTGPMPIPGACLHELFEAQARRTPEAVALIDGTREILYSELNEAAGRLAADLRRRGAGPEVVVGVGLERSAEMVIALLAILKAGAAYLPLDPQLPPARRDALIAGARVSVVVGPSPPGPLSHTHSHPPGRGGTPSPENLAYVLFTSGSTGTPKGVAITHRSAVEMVLWAGAVYSTEELSGVLAATALSFDLSVFEIFVPLSYGGTVILAQNALELPDLPTSGRVTLVNTVPSAMAELVRTGNLGASVRTVNLAGEPLPRSLVDRIYATGTVERVWNLYGPSEDTTYSTFSRVARDGSAAPGIGRPIKATKAWVLAGPAPGHPVPVGVAGELYLGGAGLARGYLHRPDWTAERFLPDLFANEPGARLYRTGDLVRWTAAGELDFLGRIDHQVKIRGFRIELGEIEAALVSLPGVREAVVAVRENRLAAYVLGDVPADLLRQGLRERLPAYMVPATWVALPALPRTSSGKVDRAALPAPDLPRPEREPTAPRTPEEEILASLWAEVLRLPRVGVHDNFFELGGDSILSLQIVSRARQAGLHLTPRQLFEYQTVAELASHAAAADSAGALRSAQGPVTGEVPLTPIQRWFLAQDFADLHHFNQALRLEPAEPLDPATLERALAAVVAHHDALRLRFRREESGWRQENAAAKPVTPFHRIDLAGLPEPRRREIREEAAAALQTGFDLAAGPLTRLALFETGDAPGELLWVAHHLVVDAVSWRVLLEDLEAACRGAGLPPKTTAYRDYALRLAGQATPEEPAEEPVLRLPVDFAGHLENTVGHEATVSFALTAEETADLLQTLPAVYHNRIDEALLSALARASACWTGSPRLRVDLEGHGRQPLWDDIDLSRTVGWFTTIHPVILEAGDAGPGQALIQARDLGGLRGTGAATASEIVFNYLGQLDAGSGGLFRPSLAPAGSTRSPRARRPHLLEVTGRISGGQLHIDLAYSSRVHRRETAERLAAAYAGALRELIRHGWTRHLALKDYAEAYPLAPLQEGLLLHSRMAPASGVYVNQVSCTLPEDLDPRRFRRAWETLVERHAVLRTAILWDGLDEPLQAVQRSVPLPWQELDWRGLPADEQRRRFGELRHRERHTPLPPDRAPLLRFALLRLDGKFGFVWTFHHLLLDGWSVQLLVGELGLAYTALGEGREPALPPVRPFRDAIAWLRGQDLSQAEQFWRRELAGFTAATSLSLPAGTEDGSAELMSGLSRAVTADLQAWAARHRLTLQAVTLGAWAALLGRYSGEEDVVFGSVVSGRPATLSGVESMVGLFINTVPVRVRVRSGELLAPWLQEIQERRLALNDFEHTPLARIQRWSEVPAGAPLFETLHVFENYPIVDAGGLHIVDLRSDEATHYPVTLALTGGDQITLRLTVDRARIEETAALRLLHHLTLLLSGMAAARESRLGEIPLLSESERHHLWAEWNDTALPEAPGVVELFEAQARRTPEAVAVALAGDEEAGLTYRELARRADGLARHLRSLGVGPEVPVGLCVEHIPELAVAVLGIFKSGGALLALDPAHPPARRAFLLEDAGVRVVVTQEDLTLPPGEGAPPPPASGDLAYLIYTSGTTGQPKAVQVEHGMLAATLASTRERFGFAAGDRMPCLALPTFDISLFELLSPLLTGGTAVLFPLRPTLDVERLVDRLGELTCLHAVPALMRQIVDSFRRRRLSGERMRRVFVGGDVVPAELLEDLRETFPAAEVWVLYGPTEGTILCAAHPVPPPPAPARSLLGRPLAGAVLHVCSTDGELLPVGVTGELWIGGTGVTRGYLGREELTAERYVRRGSERFYRTGDRVRRMADGTLEFLGRLDQQVKVRGVRIEPGEIEAALATLPGVREAVVVAREDRSGLVAYVAGDAAAEDLRRALRERLPEHMVPAAFMTLAALPLTPNRKVDRKALPAPEWQGSEAQYQTPRTPVEEVLAGLWAEILGLERVGANDHFFELGGHSLLATRVMSRLRDAFGVELPLRDLFEAPVLADLATRIEAALRSGAMRLQPPIVPAPREKTLPLSFAQQRLWLLDQLEPGRPLYNMPAALRIQGPLDARVLALCFGEILRRHEALRTVFPERDGSPVQVIQPPAPFALAVVDLSGLPEEHREAMALTLAADEAGRPFDLDGLRRGPLLRGLLLRLAKEDHLAALTLHHIVSDGWSMGILVREVTALYTAFAAGRPSPLAELPVQYADFAAWQRSWLRGEALESEISYWRRQLAGLPPLLDLPADRPRPAVQSYRGATRPVRLPSGLTRQIETLGRREGATLFMVLLAGFQALLARSSGQQDLAVGTPVAGRNRVEIEGLIGFFVNTLVLRGDLSREPTFRELLGRTRETALAAHTHQDVPFEKLVQELAPERSLAHAPLFQVMLALQNAAAASLEIPGLHLRLVNGAAPTARFDLLLSLEEHGGGLTGGIEYASDLFDATTIDRLMGHLERLLAAAVATPDLPAFSLPLLSPAECGQILVEWNDTWAVPPPRACLHELFKEQARRTPQAVALIDGTREILYRDLDQAANVLAANLRHRGAGPELVVGVHMERTAEMVTALLGILKAGAAYLPLDPQLPQARRDALIAEGRVSLVVEREGVPSLPGGRECVWERGPGGEGPVPDNLAYVLFTSGSTGTPKGVAVTHRSAVELVRWAGTVYAPEELAGVLASTSLSFDLSVFEIFVPLSCGGTVILAQNALELPDLPAAGRVTLVNTVPSAMAELVRAGSLGPSVRTVNLAGEPLQRSLADRIYATGAVERVWNLYGPSEDTTYSTFAQVPRDSLAAPTIGRPVTATKAYVLASGLEPVPVGVAGELYLGGAGLARGYLHRPDLTAERFLPNPFAADGGRLYRTGDLVRWSAAGELEFLGRVDHQVKIRGFRIELGEIEAALVALVREAAVVVRQDRLVAYVAGDLPAEALRQALRERLPDYMVPATFVALDALPLTPNGKVDRKALPAP